jgi:predicted nucleic acid-binding protein
MTDLRVALDTNILAYAEGVNRDARQYDALSLLRRIPRSSMVLPVQVLGELFNVLVRKACWSHSRAHGAAKSWSEAVTLIDTSAAIMATALDIARDHQLSIWDSVVVAAADRGGCRLLLSEDMHEGFNWGGVTVTNPFAAARHPLLEALLTE